MLATANVFKLRDWTIYKSARNYSNYTKPRYFDCLLKIDLLRIQYSAYVNFITRQIFPDDESMITRRSMFTFYTARRSLHKVAALSFALWDTNRQGRTGIWLGISWRHSPSKCNILSPNIISTTRRWTQSLQSIQSLQLTDDYELIRVIYCELADTRFRRNIFCTSNQFLCY